MKSQVRAVPVHRRNFTTALVLSLMAHAILLGWPRHARPPGAESIELAPLNVEIVEARAPPAAEVLKEPPPAAVPTVPPRAIPPPRRLSPPSSRPPIEPTPRPEPRPAPPPPAAQTRFDMAALIEARRARRREVEAEAARGEPADRTPSENDIASANINRNLRMSPREGVGGVFQILHMGTRSAEFAFNGWRPDTDRQWREVIEVAAAPGVDLEHAIVRRMIELIRSHYTGDFRWESHRLGRVIVLSARPEDNDGLEDFLIREFFGTPTLNEK